jgi:hypothetical protein
MQKALAKIAGGGAIGNVIQQLNERALLTAEAYRELAAESARGISTPRTLEILVQQLGRFEGAMGRASKTGWGLVSTVRDNWGMVFQKFGDQVGHLVKDGIDKLNNRIVALTESGKIEEWGRKTARALEPVLSIVSDLFGSKELRLAALQDFGAVVRASFQDASDFLLDALRKGGSILADSITNALARKVGLEDGSGLRKGAGATFDAITAPARALWAYNTRMLDEAATTFGMWSMNSERAAERQAELAELVGREGSALARVMDDLMGRRSKEPDWAGGIVADLVAAEQKRLADAAKNQVVDGPGNIDILQLFRDTKDVFDEIGRQVANVSVSAMEGVVAAASSFAAGSVGLQSMGGDISDELEQKQLTQLERIRAAVERNAGAFQTFN